MPIGIIGSKFAEQYIAVERRNYLEKEFFVKREIEISKKKGNNFSSNQIITLKSNSLCVSDIE